MATIYGIPDSTISQGFGPSKFNYRPYGITRNNGYFHDGEDIAGPTGTPFPAPEDGTTYHGWEPNGLGNYVVFTGDSGHVLLIGHNSRFGKLGRVRKGEALCYRGSTGNSTGPHFHNTVYPPQRDYNNGVKGAIPPIQYFNKQSSTPMPYTDRQYSDAKAAAVNFLYWVYLDRGASEADVKTWLNYDLNLLENRLKNPDDPLSEEHRNVVKKLFKQYFGRDYAKGEVKESELRMRCRQNNIDIRNDFEASSEHKQYLKSKE